MLAVLLSKEDRRSGAEEVMTGQRNHWSAVETDQVDDRLYAECVCLSYMQLQQLQLRTTIYAS